MIEAAEVYKRGELAATLKRTPLGVAFECSAEYLASGLPAVASTLPLVSAARITPAGAVPPYFAGLLPEGRRLTALRSAVKTSADDELSLLAAVGTDTIGDVTVVAAGETAAATLGSSLTVNKSFSEVRFRDLLAATGIGSRPPLAGVQDKASATMISLPVARRHERYILKLNPPENPHLVENEGWFLGLAGRCGLRVSRHRIVRDADGEAGLLVTRFDRIAGSDGPVLLAVEDACQALDLWPADKYNTTAEAAAEALVRLCSASLVAARDILQQLTFAWLTGNGDVHAKNLAVLQEPSGERRVSPAYDLPSTLLYGDTTMALTVGGRDTLSAARLRAFAAGLGLPAAVSEAVIGKLLSGTEGLGEQLRSSGLPFERVDEASRELVARHRSLAGG